jgi:hypothetical protein
MIPLQVMPLDARAPDGTVRKFSAQSFSYPPARMPLSSQSVNPPMFANSMAEFGPHVHPFFAGFSKEHSSNTHLPPATGFSPSAQGPHMNFSSGILAFGTMENDQQQQQQIVDDKASSRRASKGKQHARKAPTKSRQRNVDQQQANVLTRVA